VSHGNLQVARHARRKPKRLWVIPLHPEPLGLQPGERVVGCPVQRRDAHHTFQMQALGGLDDPAQLVDQVRPAHIHAATVEKAKVFESWAKAGKMDPVHPMHLFILLWASTQFYADFDVMAKNALATRRVRARDFDMAAAMITRVVLKGCGITSR